jgi:hypothetical protein
MTGFLPELEPELHVRAKIADFVPIADQGNVPVQNILDPEHLFRVRGSYVG